MKGEQLHYSEAFDTCPRKKNDRFRRAMSLEDPVFFEYFPSPCLATVPVFAVASLHLIIDHPEKCQSRVDSHILPEPQPPSVERKEQ